MANRSFTRSMYSLHAMPVALDCNVAIGATGAVGTIAGTGISGITRLDVGTYQIKLQDNYNRLYGLDATLQPPLTGSATDPHSETTGHVYQITTVGNTDWTTAGVPAGVTPAVGVAFLLAAQPATGTGRVKTIGVSGIQCVEIVGVTNTTIAPSGAANIGALITIQCLGATSSSVTTLIPTDPASGSVLYVQMLLSNSSLVVQGE